MEMKIIIICGILVLAAILLGLLRFWWLRKCYDKARAEKKDVLERELMARADNLLKTYSKARSATWKNMGIAVAVIAILGTAVWGIGRIVQAYKAENEQAKVEKSEEDSGKGFFYYFSTDANLERFVKNRTDELNKARAAYFEANQNLTKARQSGDLAQITKYSLKVDKAENQLDSAQHRYDNLKEFGGNFGIHCFGFGFLAICLFVLSLILAFSDDEDNLGFSSFFSFFFDFVAIISLIFSFFATWRLLVILLLLICNILIFI